jgi:signal transduction histidine kinase
VLVNDLLDFTRSRLGGGIPVVPGPMDFEKLGRETVDELAAFHPNRHIQFDATGTLQGSWDEARLGQVLSNLISNAIQHGAADSAVNVSLRGSADEVVMRVQNRGPVISSDELSRIFNPMHRGGDDAAAATHSLGLGLYISERIVVSHGGQIAVESSEEQGTTFTIGLPKTAAERGVCR